MLIAIGVVIAAALVYWFPVRRWFARWGTTPDERTREMPGDDVIVEPTDVTTHAVTVDAPPEDIWPWLVQMGYRRGGLYSYDWLDRLFGFLDAPSADRILPEFQHRVAGDKILIGPRQVMTVVKIVPFRALVLSFDAPGLPWIWQFGLYPARENRTRLISRGTERAKGIGGWLAMRVIEPAGFIMTRRMLLGVKQRAEALRGRAPHDQTRVAA